MLYDIVCQNTYKKLSLTKLLLFFVMITAGLFSCTKELDQIAQVDNVLTLSASASELVLNQKSEKNTALDFSWTTGSNSGTNSAITYTLEVDKKGSDFAAPVSIDLGKAIYKWSFTVSQLNDMLTNRFKLAAGTLQEIEARVKATVVADSSQVQTSNVLTVKVTPFTRVSSVLYLIGDATPNGWDANNATPMTADASYPTVFRYQGPLKPGEFKLITNLGQFLPSYNKGADDAHIVYRTEDSQPDDKFKISTAGVYTVEVDLLNLTASIEKQDAAPYTRLWIVGDATPNGWNIDNPNEMKVDPADPFIFTYNEVLKAGEFKIPTATGNWGGDFYMPLTNHQDLNNTGVQLVRGGNPDNKWKITIPGAYKISLNLRDMTISIKPFTPYTQLWMVGDATPAGWNIDNPTPMVKDANSPYVFIYTGPLKAGEFKIPTTTGNWGTDYFMPAVNHQDINSTAVKFTPGGNPDNKWQITAAGNYKVTLDQLRETIMIEKQ